MLAEVLVAAGQTEALDAEGRVDFMNRSALALLDIGDGEDHHEAIGQTVLLRSKGEKTASERLPRADKTFSLEAMMQDRKALQAGTSHFLGQNFAKAFDVKFQTKEGELDYVWATSWGVSTRLMGALVMAHSDDNGLVLPPKLAPTQVVIVPWPQLQFLRCGGEHAS